MNEPVQYRHYYDVWNKLHACIHDHTVLHNVVHGSGLLFPFGLVITATS